MATSAARRTRGKAGLAWARLGRTLAAPTTCIHPGDHRLTGVLAPNVAQPVEHDPWPETVQLPRQLPHARKPLAHDALPLYGADHQQEAATACASQLGPRRPRIERSGDCLVNTVVRHP